MPITNETNISIELIIALISVVFGIIALIRSRESEQKESLKETEQEVEKRLRKQLEQETTEKAQWNKIDSHKKQLDNIGEYIKKVDSYMSENKTIIKGINERLNLIEERRLNAMPLQETQHNAVKELLKRYPDDAELLKISDEMERELLILASKKK